MNLISITNSDDELLGVFHTEIDPYDFESEIDIPREIEKVYQQWIIDTDECDIEDMVFLDEYLKIHLPNIGVYPVKCYETQLSGG